MRIGYASPDLHEHSLSFFLEPILQNHTRETFAPIVFSDSLRQDAVTERLRAAATGWIDTTKLTYRQFAQAVAEERIDILVDLAGHSLRNRLPAFMMRPAPVQVTYLGYPNTTGIPRDLMHYRLTDESCDPHGKR
ncbi:MAG TPA: hypothetical protein VK797_07750 [Tepidisphaeraceae bacterium]|nr:hypothetical protein [Tepidisphaeraceae bacterium]